MNQKRAKQLRKIARSMCLGAGIPQQTDNTYKRLKQIFKMNKEKTSKNAN